MSRRRAPLVATILLLAMASPVGAVEGATERVSINAAGEPANADSYEPSLSGDGRFVVFSSSATNLVNGDRNGSGDVFVHDRATGDTRLVSRSSTGTQGNGGSGMDPDGPGALSRDGRFVAFTSSATNLVPGDTNGKSDVFVRDLKTGTTTLEDPGHVSGNAAITPDGHFLVFGSAAPDVVQGRPRRCQVGPGRSGVAGSWA
jgi:Tol biopolymer transport system component